MIENSRTLVRFKFYSKKINFLKNPFENLEIRDFWNKFSMLPSHIEGPVMYLEARLHGVAISMVLWTLIGWFICYCIAFGTGHINPILPLISMCGAQW